MSDPDPYDESLFSIERTRGDDTTDVEAATFSVNSGYTEDALGTLILESDSATASIAFWQDLPDDPPFRAGDEITAYYAGFRVFHGTVTDVTITYTTDPANAQPRGHDRQVTMAVTMAGDFATGLFAIAPAARPSQGAIKRIAAMATIMSEAGYGGSWSYDGSGGDDPGTQTQAAPVQSLGDGRFVNVLDVVREASVAMTQPVRFPFPGSIEVLTAPMADLPTPQLDPTDGESLYTEAVFRTTAGPRSIALIGQGPSGGTSATLVGDAVGPGIDYNPGLPLGLGHLVNMVHIIQMPPGPDVLVPISAKLKHNDMRIITSGWTVPARLPVIGQDPRPVKRVNYEFTPDYFAASIEFASRDFSVDPHAAWTADRPAVNHFGYFTVPSIPPGAPGGRILVVATPIYLAGGDAAAYGHQVPDTAYAYRWYPHEFHTDFTGGAYALEGLYGRTTPGELAGFASDTGTAFVTFYFTDNTDDPDDQSVPRDIDMWSPDTHSTRWTYPWTVVASLSSGDIT